MKLTPDEHYVLKGKIRQAFRQSGRFKRTLDAARSELPPALKKDGTPGKRNQVRFLCRHCGKLFPQKWVSVDHNSPVVPLWKKELEMPIEDIVFGVYCDESNLQILCSTPMKFLPKGERSCHSHKTNRENFIRDLFDKNGVPATQQGIDHAIKMYSDMYEAYLQQKQAKEQEKIAKRLMREEKRKNRG